MSKYTLQAGNNGEKILMVNGLMSRCPFTPPIAIPNPLTHQLSISMVPCSTNCPLTDFDSKHYEINCGSVVKTFKIEEEHVVPNSGNTPDSGVIKMN